MPAPGRPPRRVRLRGRRRDGARHDPGSDQDPPDGRELRRSVAAAGPGGARVPGAAPRPGDPAPGLPVHHGHRGVRRRERYLAHRRGAAARAQASRRRRRALRIRPLLVRPHRRPAGRQSAVHREVRRRAAAAAGTPDRGDGTVRRRCQRGGRHPAAARGEDLRSGPPVLRHRRRVRGGRQPPAPRCRARLQGARDGYRAGDLEGPGVLGSGAARGGGRAGAGAPAVAVTFCPRHRARGATRGPALVPGPGPGA